MNERDPLAGVAVFVAAARAGSFTDAADRLGLTKSAVGKTIARLEERLGFKLFHRSTRLTKLTPDGQAYLTACTTAIDEITSTQAALASNNQVLKGRLHIDLPVAFGRRVLLPALVEITRPHPDLQLTLTFTDATTDLLQDEVDLAVRFGELRDTSNLVARRLVTQQRVICAAPSYLRAYGVPRDLADLKRHKCIVGSRHGPPTVWFVNAGSQEMRVSPPATHRLSDAEAMIEAAIGGMGLIQLPISLLRAPIAETKLQAVLQAHSAVGVDVHAVWPQQAHLNPRVRYVIDQLVAYAQAGRLD